jgi:hypothetical protein
MKGQQRVPALRGCATHCFGCPGHTRAQILLPGEPKNHKITPAGPGNPRNVR